MLQMAELSFGTIVIGLFKCNPITKIYKKGYWDMDKDELKQLLQENLKIEIYEEWKSGTKSLNVEIYFDGETICESSVDIGTYRDY